MNIIDEIELEFLEQTGDLSIAEAAGAAVRCQLEAVAYCLGVPVEVLIGRLELL